MGVKVTVTVKTPKDMKKKVRRAIISMMDRISAFAQKVAVTRAPANTGMLRSSIHTIKDYKQPRYQGGIETNLPYAIVMEEGRKPGKWPPMDAIIRWVTLKTRRGDMKLPEGTPGSGKRRKKAIKGLAFQVARGIKKRGIPSNPRYDHRGFFKKAEKAIRLRFSRELDLLGAQIQRAWEA